MEPQAKRAGKPGPQVSGVARVFEGKSPEEVKRAIRHFEVMKERGSRILERNGGYSPGHS